MGIAQLSPYFMLVILSMYDKFISLIEYITFQKIRINYYLIPAFGHERHLKSALKRKLVGAGPYML
jgi:hypothetical protein